MAAIHLLEQSVIDKIAAGEVVERPRSIVKELTENAIDAGCSAITVEIRDGGLSMIRVTDNGEGIAPDQIRTAFLRHATSKIENVDDLVFIRSFGFRGEALSSIAAVSRVELITKTRQELMGIRYQIEGGKETGFEEVGAPDGSTFVVRDLFYNTPARRKFLKTAQTEAGYVSEFCSRLALSHPEISLKFIVNGSVKLSTSGNGKQKDVVYQVFGKEIAGNLIAIDAGQPVGESAVPESGLPSGMHLSGYIGKPQISRSTRSYEIFYVNGRLVSSQILSKAVEEGYETFLMQHKFPFVILSLTLDGKDVDVNVHPAKAQVRFSDGPGVYRFTAGAVRDALTHRDLIIKSSFEEERQTSSPARQETPAGQVPEPFETARRAGETGRMAEETARRVGETGRLDEENGFRTAEAGRRADETVIGQADETGSRAGMTVGQADETGRMAGENKDQDREYVRQLREKAEEKRHDLKQLFGSLRRENPASADSPYEAKYPQAERQRQEAVFRQSESRESDGIQPSAEGLYEQLLKETIGAGVPISGAAAESVIGKKKEGHSDLKGTQMELSDYAGSDAFLTKEHVKEHRLIGQVFETYWIIEFHDSLYIVDQHAAHEKVMFERLMKKYRGKQASSQMLSPPMIVSLSMAEEDQLNANMELFRRIGFEIEPFGDRDYAIFAVPQDLFGFTEKEFFLQMLDSLSSETGKRSVETITAQVATMACKSAVKGNMRLSRDEADALIDELLGCDNPYNCPHGRPTIISMTKKELEKKFRRIV